MSLFDQRMSTSLGVLMHHNADEVTLCAAGRDPLTLKGILGYEATVEDLGSDGRRLKRARDVTLVYNASGPLPVSEDHPYGAISSAEINGTILVGAGDSQEEYAIDGVISRSGTFIRLGLTHTKVIDKSRPGYRPRV